LDLLEINKSFIYIDIDKLNCLIDANINACIREPIVLQSAVERCEPGSFVSRACTDCVKLVSYSRRERSLPPIWQPALNLAGIIFLSGAMCRQFANSELL